MPSTSDPALDIAKWIVAQRPEVTHLKVQKLCFYAYGYLTASTDIEETPFEAWKHGPVSRLVWEELKAFGAAPVQFEHTAGRPWTAEQLQVLDDVLTVYGALSAWQLREQSHAEAPWRDSYAKRLVIPDSEIREHFRKKASGAVELPGAITNAWSLRLDGLPTLRFKTFHEAAEAYRASVS